MQLSRTTQLMTTFRGRMQLAAEAAAKEAENRSPLLDDPWLTPVSRLRGTSTTTASSGLRPKSVSTPSTSPFTPVPMPSSAV